MQKRIFKICLVLYFISVPRILSAQSMYDTDMMQTYLNAYGQMTQRAIQIRNTVQPLREQQIQLYQAGRYEESINVCIETMNQYVYYVFDNKGIRDMECLAGDAATNIRNYEQALYFYQTAIKAEYSEADSHMLSLFYQLISEAWSNYNNRYYSAMLTSLNYATRTGRYSGEYYYLYGCYYEYSDNLKEAKAYYKKAKKMNYEPAATALNNLKQKMKNKK